MSTATSGSCQACPDRMTSEKRLPVTVLARGTPCKSTTTRRTWLIPPSSIRRRVSFWRSSLLSSPSSRAGISPLIMPLQRCVSQNPSYLLNTTTHDLDFYVVPQGIPPPPRASQCILCPRHSISHTRL